MKSRPGAGWSSHVQAAWLARGPLALALLPLAALFGLLTGLRRAMYRLGWFHTTHLPIPVVVVGNLIAGGAGKTPSVIAVVKLLRRLGYTPGILSRGHGRRSEGLVDVLPDTPAAVAGDEPLLLRLRTGAPVLVGRERAAAGLALLRRHPQVNVIVCDDGLQHLALARDAQVLVFDERGAGNGWLLPAGPLREALPVQVPAQSVLLYNASRASTPLPGHLARRGLAGAVALDAWWRGEAATPAALEGLRGRPLIAAAGLARPGRFFEMLRQRGLQFTALALPDHFDFSDLPWPTDTADVIVTEKDAVKLAPSRMGLTRVWVALLDFLPDAGFDAALAALLAPPHPPADTARNDHGNPTS